MNAGVVVVIFPRREVFHNMTLLRATGAWSRRFRREEIAPLVSNICSYLHTSGECGCQLFHMSEESLFKRSGNQRYPHFLLHVEVVPSCRCEEWSARIKKYYAFF